MLNVRIIAPGELKEAYLRDACAEYVKRLPAYCNVEIVPIKEERLPDNPSQGEIDDALSAEGDRILAKLSPRSYPIALCIEGEMMSSEELAARFDKITSQGASEICLIIGSSHGLHEKVKRACRLRLSVSRMTFPHQLMRVMLLEITYRAFSILHGSRYHK